MKRRDFFKKLGIAAGAAAIAPNVFSVENKVPKNELDDFFTFLPKGNKTNYKFDKLTYPIICFDLTNKRMYADGNGRFTIQHLYKQITDEFDKTYTMSYIYPMRAVTSTQFTVVDGWDFDFDIKRLCGGSWDYDDKNLAIANVYGIGAISDPEYVQFKYQIYPGRWHSLNGISYENDKKSILTGEVLFDRGIVIDKTKDTKIIIGAFNSNNEMLDVFMQRFKGFPWRAPYPFMINFPISKYTSKWVRDKYRSYL